MKNNVVDGDVSTFCTLLANTAFVICTVS